MFHKRERYEQDYNNLKFNGNESTLVAEKERTRR